MKKMSFTTIIQGPLVAVVTGILLKIYFDGKIGWELTGDHLVSIPVTEGLNGFLGQFTAPDFGAFLNPAVYTIGITMAVVASLETLLCVEATDKLDPYKRVTPTNRELLAQGTGNIVSGFIGGLPITQVIVKVFCEYSEWRKNQGFSNHTRWTITYFSFCHSSAFESYSACSTCGNLIGSWL